MTTIVSASAAAADRQHQRRQPSPALLPARYHTIHYSHGLASRGASSESSRINIAIVITAARLLVPSGRAQHRPASTLHRLFAESAARRTEFEACLPPTANPRSRGRSPPILLSIPTQPETRTRAACDCEQGCNTHATQSTLATTDIAAC